MAKIKEQILDSLKKRGVEEIECYKKPFDPYLQEAVEHVESEEKSGIVTEVAKRGYLLNGKVISFLCCTTNLAKGTVRSYLKPFSHIFVVSVL